MCNNTLKVGCGGQEGALPDVQQQRLHYHGSMHEPHPFVPIGQAFPHHRLAGSRSQSLCWLLPCAYVVNSHSCTVTLSRSNCCHFTSPQCSLRMLRGPHPSTIAVAAAHQAAHAAVRVTHAQEGCSTMAALPLFKPQAGADARLKNAPLEPGLAVLAAHNQHTHALLARHACSLRCCLEVALPAAVSSL